MTIVYIILGVLALIIVWFIFVYNRLISLKNQVKEGWADIEVQLKRRHDLIPNLIATVKGYAEHEKGVFEKVTEARTRALSAGSIKEKAEAENALAGTLKTLFAVAENYPELKANENFLSLQSDLTDTEDKVQASRRFYNGVVRDYNITLQHFPNNIVASMFGFKPAEYFEIAAKEEREAPEVKF